MRGLGSLSLVDELETAMMTIASGTVITIARHGHEPAADADCGS